MSRSFYDATAAAVGSGGTEVRTEVIKEYLDLAAGGEDDGGEVLPSFGPNCTLSTAAGVSCASQSVLNNTCRRVSSSATSNRTYSYSPLIHKPFSVVEHVPGYTSLVLASSWLYYKFTLRTTTQHPLRD